MLKKIIFMFLFSMLILTTACSNKQATTMFVPENPQKNITDSIVRTAASQIGKPYKLGGTSPTTGFDCSGLIYWAYKQNGINVPRITVTQAKAGKQAPKNSLRPGDILVFRSSASPNGLHTGVYIGKNKFIHAPNSRSKVKIEELKNSYWGKQFIQARRIVGPVYAVK